MRSCFGIYSQFGELQDVLVHLAFIIYHHLRFSEESDMEVATKLFLCVFFVFYECFSLGKTVIDVLHRYLQL